MDSEKKSSRQKGPGPFGFILILLGFILLAQQIGGFSFENWWALFILIPAMSAFGTAIGMWQKDGRFHFGIWSTFYGGLFPLLVAVMFLFNIDWGVYWPLFVILGGFGTFLSGFSFYRPDNIKVPDMLLRHRPWPLFIGLAATLLGLTFLGRNLGWIDVTALIPFENWWGVFILIASLGGFGTALMLYLNRHPNFIVVLNLIAGAAAALPAVIAILNLDWRYMNLVTPVILILAGLGLLLGLGRRKEI
ncbi:MAG: hypothetical protein JW757_00470 [Anaerolineales bacterium]|nr:hypothetical protein [Anaerolineales bacterium]